MSNNPFTAILWLERPGAKRSVNAAQRMGQGEVAAHYAD